MPQLVQVQGYRQMEETIKLHSKTSNIIYLYFFGEKDSKGRSWCPDCVAVEETVSKAIRDYAHPDSVILAVDVGNREAWMEGALTNKFRQAPLVINSIPTLLRWKGVERLEGDYMLKLELLQLFFDEVKSSQTNLLLS